MDVISIVFIVAGAVGLLFQIASSFRRESIRIDKFLESQRKKPRIIRYDRT